MCGSVLLALREDPVHLGNKARCIGPRPPHLHVSYIWGHPVRRGVNDGFELHLSVSYFGLKGECLTFDILILFHSWMNETNPCRLLNKPADCQSATVVVISSNDTHQPAAINLLLNHICLHSCYFWRPHSAVINRHSIKTQVWVFWMDNNGTNSLLLFLTINILIVLIILQH